MHIRLPFLGALLLSSLAAAAFVPELRVRPDPEHVTANRIAGAWEADPALNERLGKKSHWFDRIQFTPDESVLARIPDELTTYIASERIWQAGMARFLQRGEEHVQPYVLATLHGNTIAVLYRSREGGRLDDGEACLLTIAQSREPERDLLFIGGDTSREGFGAYRRVAAR